MLDTEYDMMYHQGKKLGEFNSAFRRATIHQFTMDFETTTYKCVLRPICKRVCNLGYYRLSVISGDSTKNQVYSDIKDRWKVK